MNPSTDKTQTTPSFTDQVKATYSARLMHQHASLGGVKRNEIDTFDQKLDHLCALLHVAVCDDFTTYNGKIQSDYLWACAELAEEIRNAWEGKGFGVQA